MTKDDKNKFAQILTSMSVLYEKEIPRHLADIYFNALIDYSIEDVSRGFEAHVKDPSAGRFMPKPADVIRQLDNTSGSTMLAWMTFCADVVNNNRSEWDGTQILGYLGGWEYVSQLSTRELERLEEKFKRARVFFSAEAFKIQPPLVVDVKDSPEIDSEVRRRFLNGGGNG